MYEHVPVGRSISSTNSLIEPITFFSLRVSSRLDPVADGAVGNVGLDHRDKLWNQLHGRIFVKVKVLVENGTIPLEQGPVLAPVVEHFDELIRRVVQTGVRVDFRID